ncbi:Rv1733c family protein [Streptomyces mirabilis]|uniref:Rv1733c family protein n=1 Tax=Streptomyces mirabilis TaxID=68239 RepID=UPI00368206D7
MARACSPRVWSWRWRRNPLRRRSDLAEAWVLLAAWVSIVVGGLVAGLVTAGAVGRDLDRQRADARSVAAVLTKDAPTSVAPRLGTPQQVRAMVRWTAPDGSVHSGRTTVAAGSHAGARVAVWTDTRGRLTSQPLAPSEAAFRAALAGVLAAVGAGGAVWGGAQAARAALNRRRLEQWAAEWERIDHRRGWKTG